MREGKQHGDCIGRHGYLGHSQWLCNHNLGVSLLLGFGLGLVLSLVGELLKSSFTTQEEVVSYLKRPVLGSVSPIMTESEIKAIKWRKAIFASSTLFLIFSLVAILYICNQYPQLIPHAIVEKVNEIREALG